MTTRYLVDPEIAPLLEALPAVDFSQGLASVRGQIDMIADALPLAEGVLEPEIRYTPGRDGAPDVALYVYNPPGTGRKRPALLHIHGGGMVVGSAAMSKINLPPLVEAIGAVGVSVEYRLAPDTPFPGPQEDCYAALAWLVAHAEELGVDPERIIVTGESAGGGLAAALAIMTRDRGEFHLAGQVLIYPMLDFRTGGPDDIWRNPITGEFIWTREANQFGWASLRGSYAVDDERKGWFSPALAEDLSGLPPTFIAVGALDLFMDENLDYARRLIAAGVPVDLDLYAGAPHGFNMMQAAEASQRLNAGIMGALKRLARRTATKRQE